MATFDVGSADFWVDRLLRRLADRLPRYETLNKWAIGDHPLPEGDKRYVQALKDLQKKSKTNYVGLALKATTQRMRVRGFKFGGEVDDQATRIWKSNSMEMQSAMAIADASKFSDSYALISAPDDNSGGLPVITVEDPRQCVVEPDPVRPFRSLAGLKVYVDDIIQQVVIVLYLPEATYVYHGPHPGDEFDLTRVHQRIATNGLTGAGFRFVEQHENSIGVVPLIRGIWQPETELAECEDGGFEIQDRINHTMLARLIITKSQAYRQRMISNIKMPRGPDGKAGGKPPFDPGADLLWVTEQDAKAFEFEQADIKQILDAIRDDISDFAALTQTPVTYLTAQMVNVSGDALQAAQHSHVSKVRQRQDAMGWYFEQIMKLCFLYLGDPKAEEVDAEVKWQDPEVHTLAEMGDMVVKYKDSAIPLELIMERVGFSPEDIKRAVEIAEQRRQEDMQQEIDVKKAGVPPPGTFG